MSAKSELKPNILPVLKKKSNVPFVSLNKIDEELNRLEQTGILSKVENSEEASPTVYVKKKSKEIHVCADFSIGLNNALKDCYNPLMSPEDIFVKLSGRNLFFKSRFEWCLSPDTWRRGV